MKTFTTVGRIFFAISLAVFGLQYLLFATGRPGPVAGPPLTVGNKTWALLLGLGFLVAAASIASKKMAGCAALAVAIAFLLRVVLAFLPKIASNVHDPGPWTSGAEVLCLCGGALVLAASLWPLTGPGSKTMASAGRILLAVPLIVFGMQHYLYAAFVATLVPAWIPARLFWAYFVGTAFFAACVSIVARRMPSLGAGLLGLMFLLWVFIVHLPRVMSALQNGNEWTSMFVALAMSGCAFMIAGRS